MPLSPGILYLDKPHFVMYSNPMNHILPEWPSIVPFTCSTLMIEVQLSLLKLTTAHNNPVLSLEV